MIKDISEFCTLFYRSTFLPLSFYSKKSILIYSSSYIIEKFCLHQTILPTLTRTNKNPNFFITDSAIQYGIIYDDSSSGYLILGPLFTSPATSASIHNYMRECTISSQYIDEITLFIQNIPCISFQQFLNALIYIYFCINDRNIDIINHFSYENAGIQQSISNKYMQTAYNIKEQQQYHHSYLFERQLTDLIKNGDPEKLKKFLTEHTFTLKEGQVAANTLRQSKNIFITTLTIVTRTAISGGLDIEEAFNLSDTYIQECEKLQTINEITILQYTALIDFTSRISMNKIPKGMSSEIYECIQYITRHTNEVIRVEDVAKHIGRSRSYISAKFKSELGFNLNAFIMRCKLEEAKSLLTYTSKSLSEISNYLCFSSQAYFHNAFKKKYGITPNQYRQR